MIYRLCTICGKKIPQGQKCKCEVEAQKRKYKRYAAYRQDTKEQKLYSSKQWITLRDLLKTRYLGLDIYELIVNNRRVQGDTLHHIVEVKEDWSKRFNITNLIYVSNSTHRLIHIEYSKGEEQKKRMQEILFKCVEEYYKRYVSIK